MTTVSEFVAEISDVNPLQDYKGLMKHYMEISDILEEEEEYREMFAKIAKATREKVWDLLFSSQEADDERVKKAGDLLIEHKKDAKFYAPDDYNEYIVKVRNELLKRNMIDFWRDVIVKNELGLCWARDCDYYDDMYDPEPAKFYEFAGCKAPFEPWKHDEDDSQVTPSETSVPSPPLPANPEPTSDNIEVKKISLQNPVADYTRNMDINSDNTENVKKLFENVREVLWELIFKEDVLSRENFEKAAALLKEYKTDACFYDPFTYNSWIVTVRDELFKRKFYDFWKIIVERKLGLCSHLDSDYFSDSSNTDHIEFLKSGDAFLSQ